MSKLVGVFDEYTEHGLLINVDHIVCINEETGDVQLTGDKHIRVDKQYLEVIKDCFKNSNDDEEE